MAPRGCTRHLVRQMLPDTPYGQGVREIKAPMAHGLASCEGMLVRNPQDDTEWGIFFNGNSPVERQRFTIAHELGHFVLHRGQRPSFSCDKESVFSGADLLRNIEREADDFASNLLIPGDLLRDAISDRRIDLHILSALAKRFQVSFESLCIRFIKFTPQRAILVYWDNASTSGAAAAPSRRVHASGAPMIRKNRCRKRWLPTRTSHRNGTASTCPPMCGVQTSLPTSL